MTRALLALTLLLSLPVLAQDTIHIVSVSDHIRSKDEPSFSVPLHTKIVTGRIDDHLYTLQEAALFAYHFEVGKNYEVAKATDKQVKIRVTDKKGRTSTETLQVVSIAEVTK